MTGRRHHLTLAAGLAIVALPAVNCAPVGPSPAQVADAIYAGGDIVTVNDAQPDAEAVAVKDGKILAVGARRRRRGAAQGHVHARRRPCRATRWCRASSTGTRTSCGFGSQAIGANLLAPPDGTVNTIDDLVAQLQAFAKGPDVARTGWIFGIGYDDALLGRHPNRDDLDRVSTDDPGHRGAHLRSLQRDEQRRAREGRLHRRDEGSRGRRDPPPPRQPGTATACSRSCALSVTCSARSAPGRPRTRTTSSSGASSWPRATATRRSAKGRLLASQQAGLASAAERGLLDIDVTVVRRLHGSRGHRHAVVRTRVPEPLPHRRHEDHARRLAAGTHGVADDSLPDRRRTARSRDTRAIR